MKFAFIVTCSIFLQSYWFLDHSVVSDNVKYIAYFLCTRAFTIYFFSLFSFRYNRCECECTVLTTYIDVALLEDVLVLTAWVAHCSPTAYKGFMTAKTNNFWRSICIFTIFFSIYMFVCLFVWLRLWASWPSSNPIRKTWVAHCSPWCIQSTKGSWPRRQIISEGIFPMDYRRPMKPFFIEIQNFWPN